MRYLSVVWLLPLLFFSHSVEAARITFASENCGTPPLLGLTFEVELGGTISGGTTACPDVAVGGLVGDGGEPLYGTQIGTLQIAITSTGLLPAIQVDTELSDFDPLLTFSQIAGGVLLTADFTVDESIFLNCDSVPSTIPSVVCEPQDLLIGLLDLNEFVIGTSFRVVAVNDSTVPEPTTLALFGIGVVAAAVRRRRPTARTGD